MNLGRLTDEGLARFRTFLESQETESPEEMSMLPLANSVTSQPVIPRISIEVNPFGSRFEAAKYLNELLEGSSLSDVDGDARLWAWLAWFHFEQLCPVARDGKRHPGELARWIPDIGNFRRYYRHLLAGPYRIYRAHRDKPERALAVLMSALHQPGDIVEQLASRQELVTNAAVMEVATMLYVEPISKKAKRGSGGRGPGSPRRLADVLNQFDVTWDLYAMESRRLLAMLPREFEKFRNTDGAVV